MKFEVIIAKVTFYLLTDVHHRGEVAIASQPATSKVAISNGHCMLFCRKNNYQPLPWGQMAEVAGQQDIDQHGIEGEPLSSRLFLAVPP